MNSHSWSSKALVAGLAGAALALYGVRGLKRLVRPAPDGARAFAHVS